MPRLSRRTRAVLAFVALPGVVAFAAPLLLVWLIHTERGFAWYGLLPLIPGIALLAWCARQLTVRGEGTLAPWDPTRRLVTTGPYARSRNPMYLAVGLILAAWAIGFRSWPLAVYTLVVLVAFHLRIVLNEEPTLAQRHSREWTRYTARVPRWIFTSRRAAVATILLLLAAVPVAGVFYEVYADARAGREFPPPGMYVDVGGRQLHVVCAGEGSPAVVFEPSGFGPGSIAFATVRDRLARHTRVCSYDRAGTAWSDPGPDAMSSGDLAQDLAVVQDRVGLPAPIVLVASSIGGLTVEMFARQFPERVGALVFLDAANSGALAAAEAQLGRMRLAARTGSIAAHLGLIRLWDPFRIPLESEEGRRSAALTYGSKSIDGLTALVSGLPRSVEEFAAAPPLPADLPLLVLTAADTDRIGVPWLSGLLGGNDADWVASHKALAAASSRGTWKPVPDSDHLIAASHPDVVIDEVLMMVEAVRPAASRRARLR